MFDARRLLDQVLQTARTADLGTMARNATQDRSQLLTGPVAGGLVGVLLGNRSTRRMLGSGAGTALKLGGLAAVGALAYAAWQKHQSGKAPAIEAPPAGTPFANPSDRVARGVLVAMIQGAKADGHIDAEEQRRIFGHVESLSLDPEAKAFVMDELAAPSDIGRITAHAEGPESATELYAAALLAMDPDQPAERAWLASLARALALDPALAREVEATVARAG